MARNTYTLSHPIVDGANLTVSTSSPFSNYLLTGTPTLTSNWAITYAGTPLAGCVVNIRYEATITLGGNIITILGTAIPDAYSAINYNAIAVYDGSAWQVNVMPDWENSDIVETHHLISKAVTLDCMADLSRGSIYTGQTALKRPVELDAKTNAYILIGDGTDINSVAISGDIAIDNAGVTTIVPEAVELAMMADLTKNCIIGRDAGTNGVPMAVALGDGEMLFGNAAGFTTAAMTGDVVNDNVGAMTIQPGAVDVAMCQAELRDEMIVVNLSFETGEIGRADIYIPYKCTLEYIHASVQKLIEATDDATINFKDNGGNDMTGGSLTAGSLTLTAGSAIASNFTSTVLSNNTFTAGQIMQITTVKTTAGGKATVSLKFTRVD